MASEKMEQDSVLAAMEAKAAAWRAAADSYRAAIAIDGPLETKVGLTGVGAKGQVGHLQAHTAADLPVGVFRDKSIKEAIAIYLAAGHRKQTNKEIAIGLQKGGIATMSANFEATVGTALHRMKDEGTILRFPDGWDLASSYPDSLRGRLEKDAKPRRKAGSGRTANRGKAKASSGPKALRIKIKKAKPSESASDADLKAVG